MPVIVGHLAYFPDWCLKNSPWKASNFEDKYSKIILIPLTISPKSEQKIPFSRNGGVSRRDKQSPQLKSSIRISNISRFWWTQGGKSWWPFEKCFTRKNDKKHFSRKSGPESRGPGKVFHFCTRRKSNSFNQLSDGLLARKFHCWAKGQKLTRKPKLANFTKFKKSRQNLHFTSRFIRICSFISIHPEIVARKRTLKLKSGKSQENTEF